MFNNFFRWLILVSLGVLLFGALAFNANATCTMTTVIDPVTGQYKFCQSCCEAGMCTVVCQ